MVKTTIQGTSGNDTQGFGTTLYYSMGGYRYGQSVEINNKCRIHETLTAKNLYVCVLENTLNNSTTVRSRKNGANGNLSVSIPAGTTGEFEDTVNSDSLVSGDDFNYQSVAGGSSGLIRYSYISCTIEHATVQTSILCLTYPWNGYTGNTYYDTINGKAYGTLVSETNAQYTIRFSCTLSRLNVYVSSNNVVNATTVRTRKNGANGAQSISIPGKTSGYFENGVNQDSLVSGDMVNLQEVVAAGGKAGYIYIEKMQMMMKVTASDSFLLYSGLSAGDLFVWDATYYYYICGLCVRRLLESDVRLKTRAVYIKLNNLFVRVVSNAQINSTTFRTRRNGGNGNLSVSIPAGATGAFEDTTHEDTILIGDRINYQLVPPPTMYSGAISICSVEATLTVAPPPAVETPMVSSSYYLLRRRV